MKSAHCFQYVLLILFLGIQTKFCSASANSISSTLISPVSNFETALKASSAHGTIVAIKAHIKEEGPCIILVSKSMKKSAQKKRRSMDEDKEQNLDIHAENLVRSPEGPLLTSSKADSLFHLFRCHDHHQCHTCILGITGFAPDAQHILRYAAKSVSDYKHIYSGTGSSGVTSNIIKRQVVDPVSDRLKSAAFSDGGRPFGIQALVVGLSQTKHREKDGDDQHPACFYSIDPSGGWRSWGGHATAIGNHAELTRNSLWSQTREFKDKKYSLPMEEALKIAMKALLTPNISDEQDDNRPSSDVDLEQLDAIVLILNNDSKCISLGTPFLQNIYEKYISVEK